MIANVKSEYGMSVLDSAQAPELLQKNELKNCTIIIVGSDFVLFESTHPLLLLPVV